MRYQLISINSGRILWSSDSHAEAWNALVKLTAAGYAVAMVG